MGKILISFHNSILSDRRNLHMQNAAVLKNIDARYFESNRGNSLDFRTFWRIVWQLLEFFRQNNAWDMIGFDGHIALYFFAWVGFTLVHSRTSGRLN